jgi:nitrite reductase/ring-hydroxylating ferredoxin subunit
MSVPPSRSRQDSRPWALTCVPLLTCALQVGKGGHNPPHTQSSRSLALISRALVLMHAQYIWTLIRGEDGAGAFDGDVSNVYATDGSCRACTFPMVKGSLEGSVVTCGSCGSKFDLEDGSVVEWLPGQGVMGFMAKQLNSKKEPIDAGILRTRVSQSGRVYVRLPDGTLPITKTAAVRAAELAAPLTAQEQVKAAQEKAKGN